MAQTANIFKSVTTFAFVNNIAISRVNTEHTLALFLIIVYITVEIKTQPPS